MIILSLLCYVPSCGDVRPTRPSVGEEGDQRSTQGRCWCQVWTSTNQVRYSASRAFLRRKWGSILNFYVKTYYADKAAQSWYYDQVLPPSRPWWWHFGLDCLVADIIMFSERYIVHITLNGIPLLNSIESINIVMAGVFIPRNKHINNQGLRYKMSACALTGYNTLWLQTSVPGPLQGTIQDAQHDAEMAASGDL